MKITYSSHDVSIVMWYVLVNVGVGPIKDRWVVDDVVRIVGFVVIVVRMGVGVVVVIWIVVV